MRTDNSKIKEVFKGLTFSKEDIQTIESVFYKGIFKKGTMLQHEGDVVDYQYYVYSGCLRSYHVDNQGREHTVHFAVKDWWIADYSAYFTSSKAIMTIEVLKDAVLYKLSKSDKDYLYSQVPQIETFFRIKLERALASFEKRIIANLSETATQRYINFINTYSNIEKIVKNYHIASYLGITTESLSRIRKELSQS